MNIKKRLREILLEGLYDKTNDYKSWKRKNVTLRGISKSPDEFNGGSAIFGDGLYTASLGNKVMAKGYGDVYYVVNARPKNPIVFNDLNRAEIWLQQNILFKKYKDIRDFHKHTTIQDEVQKLGYDGIEVKGREIVNYKPENVKYFKTEDELINYFNSINVNLTEQMIDGQAMNQGTQTACNTMSVATYKEGLKLIIDAIGHPNENPKMWSRISKPLHNWQQEDLEIGHEKSTEHMSGDSMIDESNTYWTMIQNVICETGNPFQ